MCGPEPRIPDFDWFTDDAVVVRGQLAVAAYLNQDGDLVLRREAHPFCDECDSVIVVGAHYVPRLAAAMLGLVGQDASSGALVSKRDANSDASFTQEASTGPLAKRSDPTNAERQRRHRRNRNGTVTLRTVTPDGENFPTSGSSEPALAPDTDTESETRPTDEAERAFDFIGGTRPAKDG